MSESLDYQFLSYDYRQLFQRILKTQREKLETHDQWRLSTPKYPYTSIYFGEGGTVEMSCDRDEQTITITRDGLRDSKFKMLQSEIETTIGKANEDYTVNSHHQTQDCVIYRLN